MRLTFQERRQAVRSEVEELRLRIRELDVQAGPVERAIIAGKTGLDLQLAMGAVRKFTRASSNASKRLDSAVTAADSADSVKDAEDEVVAVKKGMERLMKLLFELEEARMQTAFNFRLEP